MGGGYHSLSQTDLLEIGVLSSFTRSVPSPLVLSVLPLPTTSDSQMAPQLSSTVMNAGLIYVFFIT